MRLSAAALAAFLALSSSATAFSPAFLVTTNGFGHDNVGRMMSPPSSFPLCAAKRSKKSGPSRVSDPDGPTPPSLPDPVPLVDKSEIPELQPYDPVADAQIPYQPWRRGDADGCQDALDVPWRLEAQAIIRTAAVSVGASVLDITWNMGSVVVTIDEDCWTNVEGDKGPEIRVQNEEPGTATDWGDPDDAEDDFGRYAGEEDDDNNEANGLEEENAEQLPTRDEAVRNMTEEEFEKYVTEGDEVELIGVEERYAGGGSFHNDAKVWRTEEEFMDRMRALNKKLQLSHDDFEMLVKDNRNLFVRSDNEADLEEAGEFGMLERQDGVDTDALSIIANAIVQALDEVEDRLEILSRHELILSSPGFDSILTTQRQFDAYRGFDVIVETDDPFGSNRTLKGKLVDRNALDVVINIKGRMVTVPQNMIQCVSLPPAKTEKGVPQPRF